MHLSNLDSLELRTGIETSINSLISNHTCCKTRHYMRMCLGTISGRSMMNIALGYKFKNLASFYFDFFIVQSTEIVFDQ